MRAREFLILESSGIFNRKTGDEFYNAATGQSLEFQRIVSYPSSGQFTSLEERKQVQAQVAQSKVIQWVNSGQENDARYLAFAVAELTDSDGHSVYWGRYFKEIVGSMLKTWSNNEVPAGWKLNTRSSKKMQVGYDPQRVIGDEEVRDLTSIVDLVSAKLGKDNELSRGLAELMSGQLPVFKNMGDQMTVIRDYFGEIMAPVALAANLVGGDADAARSHFLGQNAWNQCRVKWPMSVSHNLVDSYLYTPDNLEIGISSKGGKGARASVKNIYDLLLKVQQQNPDLLAEYTNEAQYIKDIYLNDQFYGPIDLANTLGILTWEQAEAFAEEVKNLIRNPSAPISGLIRSFTANKSAVTTGLGYNPGYHALSALAGRVADYLNKNTNIQQLMKLLLNNTSMLQIYTKMGVKGNDAIVTGFVAVYPPQFSGTISISANKGYSATGIKGKLVFGFD